MGCRWVAEPRAVASFNHVTTHPVTPGLLASISTAIVRFTCPGNVGQASMTDCKSRSTVLDSVMGRGVIGGFPMFSALVRVRVVPVTGYETKCKATNRSEKPGDFRLGGMGFSCHCTPFPPCAVTVSVTVSVTHKPFVRLASVVTVLAKYLSVTCRQCALAIASVCTV